MRLSSGLRMAAFALAVCLTGAAAAQGGGQAPTLIADTVREQSAGERATLVGRFVSIRGGPIAARTGGAVDEVLVEVGVRVEQGQVLVRLALDRLRAEKQRRQAMLNFSAAQIKTAKANLKLAQQSESRLSRLRASAAFSEALFSDKQREAERAAAQVQQAEADYARAHAELKLADVDLAYAEVRAPYGGVVAERHVDVGGFVPLGGPVVTLIGDKDLEIEAEVPSDRAAALAASRAIIDLTYAGVTANVPVRAVLPRETGVSRTRTARFGPLPQDLARVAIANAAVTLNAPIGNADTAVTVHKDAIVRRPTGPTVIVAKPNAEKPGEFVGEPRPVRLGAAVGARFIVLDGLQPGERVIVRGNENLRPGASFKLAGGGG